MTGLWLAIGLVGGVATGAPPAPAPPPPAPPPVERLFGCPLLAPAEAFEPDARWTTHRLDALGVQARAPADWTVEALGEVVILRSPDDHHRMTIRRGREVGPRRLAFVRRSVELSELGPSHAGARCEAGLIERLSAATGLSPMLVGVYGRPLGDRRRGYALYAGLGDASLTVVVHTRWSRRARTADLGLVRRLLGSISAAAPASARFVR